MTFDTLTHIEAMQKTALALEEQARASGQYSRDCAHINDAITRGQKSGVALLWDSAGRMEIVDLNGGSKHCAVRETDGNGVVVEHDFPTWNNPGPSAEHKDNSQRMGIEETSAYTQVNQESFRGMAAHSHERANAAGGKFPPQVHEGHNPLGDAARAMRQREEYARSRRNALSDEVKNFTRAQMERNNRIVAQMKAASDKQWKTRSA